MMKSILYYLLLLILICLTAGFLLPGSQQEAMSMPKMLSVSAVLVIYTVALSLVGEGKNQDERQVLHKNLANRFGLIAGTIILSFAILYQLFTHRLDYWLLVGLIGINLTKIVSLIYLEKNK